MSDNEDTPDKEEEGFTRKAGQPLDNPKAEQFCREFIIDMNATQAYIRAGYSSRGANGNAARLIASDSILDRIAELKAESLARVVRKLNPMELEIKADKVLGEMASMAYVDMSDYYSVDDKGQIYFDFKYLKESGLARNIRKIKYKEMTAQMVVEAGIELPRVVFGVEIELWDKPKTSESLMKHLGLLKEKVEVEGLADIVAALQAGRARVAKESQAVKEGKKE